MPLFYFHVDDGDEHACDRLAVELPDLRAARREATLLAGEMLRDRPDDFWDARSWRTIVQDETGLTLFTIDVDGVVSPAIVRQLSSG